MVNYRTKRFWAAVLLIAILIALGIFSKINRRSTYRLFNPLVAVDVENITWDDSANAYRIDSSKPPPALWFSWPLFNERALDNEALAGNTPRFILYENGKRLENTRFPAASDDKSRLGISDTTFSLFFTTPDGSDPRENAKKYAIACPWIWAGGNRSAGNFFFLSAASLAFFLFRAVPFARRIMAKALTVIANGYAWILRIGGSHHRLILAIAILYPFAVSLLFSLSTGEFVTKTEEVAMHRTADFQAPILHDMNGTLETLPPLYGKIAKVSGKVFPAFMVKSLVFFGVDFYIALAAILVLLRAAAVWAWLPWFAWLKLPRWFVIFFAPLHLFVSLYWGQVYRYQSRLVICGQITVTLFLLAAGLALLGRIKLAIVVWLLQAWTHPATFSSWSLLFLALILLSRGAFDNNGSGGQRWMTGHRLTAAVCAALALLPIAGAWAAGLAEQWEVVRLGEGRHYWDFVISRNVHSLFGGIVDYKANVPAIYLLMVAGLFLLSMRLTPLDKKLRLVNRFFACTGLAYYGIYISLVETHFSVLANMLLPLRFETLYLPLYVLNILALVFHDGDTDETSTQSTWVQMAIRLIGIMLVYPMLTRTGEYYSSLLYLFPFLTHALLWGEQLLGPNGSLNDKLRTIVPSLALTATVCLATIIMLHVQTRSADMFQEHLQRIFTLPYPFTYDGLLFCALGATVFATINITRDGKQRVGYAYLSVLLFALLGLSAVKVFVKVDWKNSMQEVSLLASGLRARTIDSPWNRFRQWRQDNVAPNDGILNEPSLLLCLIGVPSTSINNDILAFSLYAPDMADPLADDLKDTFDVDIGELAARGQALCFDWAHVKDKYLHGDDTPAADKSKAHRTRYRWLIEQSDFPARAKDAGRLVFENEVLRVYDIPQPSAAVD